MSTISKLNVDAIIDKSITSDKLADDFMLLSDALENEEVIAAALTELNNTKADKTTVDEITQTLASKADAEVVRALQQDLDSKAYASELNNYLPLSGGKLNTNAYIEWGNSGTDNDISDWNAIKQDTGLRIISSIDENSGAPRQYSTGLHVRGRYGFQLASQGGSTSNFFIRNVGTTDTAYTTWKTLIHSDNLSNYALPISGGTLTGSVYPNTTDTINLGDIGHRFASVAVGQIKGLTNVTNETFKSNWLQPGLSVISNIAPTNGDGTYADYGLPAYGSGAEGGIINFRTVNAPAANSHYYLNQLGFDRTGIYWRNTTDNANQSWKCLSSPSIFESAVPKIYEYSSNPKFIPELRNGNIINIFHKISKNNLKIERSQDGSTWTDTTETEWEAFSRIMTEGLGATTQCVAYDGSTGKVGDRLRITINGAQAYSYLSHLYIYFSTVGNTTKLTIERNGYGDQDNWRTVINKQSVLGWSGPNYYGLNNQLIGRTADNSGYSWRLTFEITAVNASYNSKGEISKIYCFSSQSPWAISANPTVDWYYNVAEGRFISNYSIRPRWNVSSSLGTSEYKWNNVYANNFYGRLYTPNGTHLHFVKGDGQIVTQVNVTHDAQSVAPTHQAICVNAATGTDDITKMPGIGFHNPGKTYATLKYTGNFEFMDEKLTGYKNVKAAKFIGDLQGTAQNATNDSSGNKIVDTYALASTCYGGPEGKFAIGNSDNLIGKTLTGSWGIYNKYHDIVISEYDASTNTWVEKFNSTTLTGSSKDHFEKGLQSPFYTSTRGSKVKITVTSNAGACYVQAISLYLKTKDATYSGNIDYSYWTNGGKTSYSGISGTWGTWCSMTMSGTYRSSFEIFFNEGGANAQITINGFRIATQTDGIVPVLIGKSHESYKADNATTATTANTASTASTATKVGDNTIQLYAQSGNEINFGGTNINNPSIIFGYKSADGNQIVPTQYKFGKDATASVYASKFITTGGTATQVVLGDGTLKNVSELGSSSLTYATLANTNIINAGFNYNNTYSGLTIDTYTGFTMDTPDTVIVSAYPITFSGSIMKMEGIENLSGNFYIYCLSFMANQMVAVNGAAYN